MALWISNAHVEVINENAQDRVDLCYVLLVLVVGA